MKKLVLLFVILLGFFTSCQKSDLISESVDTDAIRAEVAALPSILKTEAQALLSSGKTLKDATLPGDDDRLIVYLFELDEREIYFVNNFVTKYFIYYEVDFNGYRVREYTISQKFQIKDGKVDTSSHYLDFEIGCPQKKSFYFSKLDYISSLTYYFRFNDGRQFLYFTENYSGTVKLPPIKGGKWQIEGMTFDGDLRQQFLTTEIDCYSESNVLSLIVKIKETNIQSYVEISKSFIKGSNGIQLRGQINGRYVYLYYHFAYTEELPQLISYGAPFQIEEVSICNIDGCWWWNTNDMKTSIKDGKIVYLLQ